MKGVIQHSVILLLIFSEMRKLVYARRRRYEDFNPPWVTGITFDHLARSRVDLFLTPLRKLINILFDVVQDVLLKVKVFFKYTVKLGYNELGYNELGYNEHSVITNKFLSQIGYYTN